MKTARCMVLAATTLVFALSASPASAEISSVDAYGGQAAVLGKPGPARGGSRTSSGAGSNRTQTNEGRSRSRQTSGSEEEASHSGSHAGSSGTAGPKGSGGSGAGGKSSTGSGSPGSTTARARGGQQQDGRGAPTKPGLLLTNRTGAGEEPTSAVPISALDIVLIALGGVFLLATALLLRRVEPASD